VAKPGKSAERRQRLAAALRENLKRRKARVRAQAADGAGTPAEAAVHTPDLPATGPDKAGNRG
jgi:hypothetical protein